MRPQFTALALIVLAPCSAAAFELPPRKAGLWDLHMGVEGRPGGMRGIQQCTDGETDKFLNSAFGGMKAEMCSKQDSKKVGDTLVIDSVCNISGKNTVSHAVVTGSFDRAYIIKVTSRPEGAQPGSEAETHLTVEAKWAGPCKADQRPGDIILPGGIKMNVRELRIPGGLPTR